MIAEGRDLDLIIYLQSDSELFSEGVNLQLFFSESINLVLI